ncbi:hypothetical protein AAL_07918 [Moelleriella libera RCEF 2490]|uniref:Protein kinase-like domain protein n=1 Tax=Moelleriella libera RCEF 2490 TaxID=1081109 RepID=A0A167WKM8_9HYPO|nr:hypothetical protein AAL_07918 [Moelleriella libera RCEF 2490]
MSLRLLDPSDSSHQDLLALARSPTTPSRVKEKIRFFNGHAQDPFQKISFRFKGHDVTAQAKPVRPGSRVLRVDIDNKWQSIVGAMLPQQVILKHQRTDEEVKMSTKELETEIETYGRLKALQGKVIPRFLGRVEYQGLKAILLSAIDGFDFWHWQTTMLPPEELFPLLRCVIGELGNYDFWHSYNDGAHFILVDADKPCRRLMAVGLGSKDTLLPTKLTTEQLADLFSKWAFRSVSAGKEDIYAWNRQRLSELGVQSPH